MRDISSDWMALGELITETPAFLDRVTGKGEAAGLP